MPGTAAIVPGPEGAVTSHVVVVSVDGLRPDAIDRFGAATLQRLVREGSHAADARTVVPSITLPAHASMVTGLPPDEHGITWNNDQRRRRGTVQVPTIFGLAHVRGFRTAAFFSKAKLLYLAAEGTLDHHAGPEGVRPWAAARTVGAVERHLAGQRPNLLFVHFADVDRAGHASGWMSAPYGRAVREVDAAVGRLLGAADRAYGAGEYTLILTADHGGSGRTHTSPSREDAGIPWIAWGRGVRTASSISSPVSALDTPATVLWLLGVEPPSPLGGTPVRDAFVLAPGPEPLGAGVQ